MSDPSGEASRLKLGPPTVLVVEDEILVRMLITDSLRDAGFTVIEADNADEALSVLRGGCPVDVVVSDVRTRDKNHIGVRQSFHGRFDESRWSIF
jgi:CheY-like chemotaxis protein